LKGTGNRIELLIADNGKGFDTDQVQGQRTLGGGSGLHSMKERAELSGESLFIESNEGAGTIVRASWPC
jgi:signal transduction histidine kinase